MDLRKAFFKKMCELAEKDDKVVLLTDDLGYSFCEEFAKRFPKQFINSGIMEDGTTGFAAGMALGGMKPYFYGGTVFVLMRNYEQLRDDICYNNLNVKIIGTKASGFLGFSHNLEGNENELDLLKNLPNIGTYFPKDEEHLIEVMDMEFHQKEPAFIRI